MRITRLVSENPNFRIVQIANSHAVIHRHAQASADMPSREFAANIVSNLMTGAVKNSKVPEANRLYIQSVYELFNDASIDNLKDRDSSSSPEFKAFGDKWGQKIQANITYQAQALGLEKKPTPEITESKESLKKDRIKLIIAVTLKDDPTLNMLTIHVKDRLNLIKQVYDASTNLQDKYRAIGVDGEVTQETTAEAMRNIQNDIVNAYARTPGPIAKNLEKGFRQIVLPLAMTEAPRQPSEDIANTLKLNYALALSNFIQSSSAATPTPDMLSSIGKNLLTLLNLVINAKAIEDKSSAQVMANQAWQNLNTTLPKWMDLLTPSYKKELNNFFKIPETSATTSPTKSSAKTEINSLFKDVYDKTDKPAELNIDQLRDLESDLLSVAKAFGHRTTDGIKPEHWPKPEKVREVALAVLQALIASSGETKADGTVSVEMYKAMEAAAQNLQRVWPGWQDACSRIRGIQYGPLETFNEHHGRKTSRNRLNQEQYEKLFWMTAKKASDLIIPAVQAAQAKLCTATASSKWCSGYKALLENIQGDAGNLAKPMDVSGYFQNDNNGKSLHSGSDFPMAKSLIASYTELQDRSQVNEARLNEAVNAMLIQVNRWATITQDPKATFLRDDDWMMNTEKEKDKSKLVEERFQKDFSSMDAWADPHVIVFCSVLLYVLYGMATGSR